MKLYGVAFSNYYNIVKLALLEKGLPFDEVHTPPSQDPEVTAHSPLGKIPYLQHGNHFISESQAILFYLERLKPAPPLYPREPFAAARAQQIHQFIDLYIDPPARSLLPMAFFDAEADAPRIESVDRELRHNLQALNALVSFNPYIAGHSLTHADLAAFMTLRFVQTVMIRVKGHDPLSKLYGVGAYLEMISIRGSCQQVVRDQQAALAQLTG